MGYTYTTIGKAVILLYTWPIFAMLFGMIILKEKINARKLVLIVTAFSGVVLIYSGNGAGMRSDEYLGLAAITFSAMIYSITVVLFKKESVRFTSWETVFFQNLLGTFIYFPFLFLVDYQMQVNQALAVTAYGMLIGLAGFGLFFSSLQDLKASTVSFLNYIEVVSAITLGIIFFNEKLTMEMVMGGALIIAAATLVQKE
jgi:drug/metabolite transporter (DMT)-like permease